MNFSERSAPNPFVSLGPPLPSALNGPVLSGFDEGLGVFQQLARSLDRFPAGLNDPCVVGITMGIAGGVWRRLGHGALLSLCRRERTSLSATSATGSDRLVIRGQRRRSGSVQKRPHDFEQAKSGAGQAPENRRPERRSAHPISAGLWLRSPPRQASVKTQINSPVFPTEALAEEEERRARDVAPIRAPYEGEE